MECSGSDCSQGKLLNEDEPTFAVQNIYFSNNNEDTCGVFDIINVLRGVGGGPSNALLPNMIWAFAFFISIPTVVSLC